MLRIFTSLFAAVLFCLFSATAQAAPPDTATLTKRVEESGKTMLAAIERAKVKTQAVRKAIVGEAGRISDDMTEIETKLASGDLGVCLGQWAITWDRVEQLPEEERPALRKAMQDLRIDLQAAFTAQSGQEALKELIDRLDPLKAALDNGEGMDSPLDNIADTLSRVELAGALPRAEIVALRIHLGSIRAAYSMRMAKEMLEKATMDFASLEAAMADIRKEFDGNADMRSSAHAKFTDFQRSINDSLSRVPESDANAKKIRESLAKLTAEQVAAYVKTYGDMIHASVKENYEFTADQFADWDKEIETVAPTAADYINLEGSHYAVFHLPRTVAYVDRSNISIAHVAMQDDAQLCASHAKLREFSETIRKNRIIALDRVYKHADTLITELEKTPIEEDRVRDRFQLLADWDIRVALQEDPRQWPLIARLHKMIDAYDRKTLGEEKALAKTRHEAATTAEGHWTRMGQRVPAIGGFNATHSGLFKGKLVRVENLNDFSASFKPADHDLVLDIDGNYFAAKFDPALKKELAVQLGRVKMTLTPQDTMELHMLVGDESTLEFLPQGDAKSVTVSCRKMTVMGIRFGPVAIIVR